MATLGVLTAAASAILIAGLAVRIGFRSGVVDVPDGYLKMHSRSAVPLGGVAVVAGSQVGLAVTGLFDPWLLLALLFVGALGLIDDLRGLSPLVRLAGALVAGLILTSLSFDATGVIESAFWVVAVVVAINAINLFDGLDALAGSVAIVIFLGISSLGMVQNSGDPVVGIILASVMAGFLYWNWPPARLFHGDNGAYTVAVLIVWSGEQASPDLGGGVVAVGLIGMPLLDLGITVIRRGLAGAELFAGDRDHVYDLLHERGLSTRAVALVFASLQVVWVTVLVLASYRAGDRMTIAIAVLLGLTIVGLVVVGMAKGREAG